MAFLKTTCPVVTVEYIATTVSIYKGCRIMPLAPGKHPLLLVEARVQRHMGTMQGLPTAGTVSHCRCGFLFEPDIDEYNEQRSSKTNATQL